MRLSLRNGTFGTSSADCDVINKEISGFFRGFWVRIVRSFQQAQNKGGLFSHSEFLIEIRLSAKSKKEYQKPISYVPYNLNNLSIVPVICMSWRENTSVANFHQEIIQISFVVIPAIFGKNNLLQAVRSCNDFKIRRVDLQNKLVSVLT